VLQKLLRKVRKGARIVYIPGNHDEAMRSCCGMSFGGIDVQRDAIHTTADGKRLWIVHGDEYEAIARYGKWVRFLGDFGYELLTGSNLLVKWTRRRLGFGYWSLANYLKDRVSGSRAFIAEFEAGLAAEARRRGCDGVVCGHIHYAQDREIDGVRYLNTGDWVDSRTALVESIEGEVRLLRWQDIEAAVRAPAVAPATEPVLTAA
jgi:UDP-2,3-diacylglucosamine pyrophosphatase LpxH